MAYRKRHFEPRKRVPPELGRVELNVLKLDEDGNSVYDDFDKLHCNCFPRPSQRTIPSMLYDHINCPHVNNKHIQPAQQYVFTYPWTASSDRHVNKAKGGVFESDSNEPSHNDKLSIIGEEDDDLESLADSIEVTRTAPPFATHYVPSRKSAPYTAPVGDSSTWETKYPAFHQSVSQPSLTGFRRQKTTKKEGDQLYPSTPYVEYQMPTRGRPNPDPNHYYGHYVDPYDGRVYDFKVNYGNRAPKQTPLQKQKTK